MNNNLRKILTAVACIAAFGNSGLVAYSESVTIKSQGLAYGENSNAIIDLSNGMLYTWEDGASGSVDVYLETPGYLIVGGYSYSTANGVLQAEGGDLYLDSGVLTINSSSQIAKDANVTAGSGTTIYITGGDVSLDSGDSIEGSVNLRNGELTVKSGYIGEDLTVSGGNAELSGSWVYGSTTVSGGTAASNSNIYMGDVNIAGGTVDSYNDGFVGSVNIKSGELTAESVIIGEDLTVSGGNAELSGSTVYGGTTVSGGTAASNSNIYVGDVNIAGGTVDSYNDGFNNIYITNGTINLDDTTKSGVYTQTGGAVTITGDTFNLDNSSDVVSGGTMNIGSNTSSGTVAVNNGTITNDAQINITSNGQLKVSGGNVTLDADDTYNGTVNISSGSLTLAGAGKSSDAVFTQSGGTTTVTGKTFDLNNENDYIDGGSLIIGNGTASSKLTVSEGAISDNTWINLTHNAALDITGGDVKFSSQSVWDGNISISDGTLRLTDADKSSEGTFTQTGGKTTVIGTGLDLNNSEDVVSGGTLNIGNDTTASELNVSKGTVESGASVNIYKNAALDVSGGDVSLDSGDSWYGDVNVTDGSLTISDLSKSSSGVFIQSGGETTITGDFDMNNSSDSVSGGTLNIGSGSTAAELDVSKGTITGDAAVNINKNSALKVSGGDVTLDNADTYNGNITVSGGSLALVGINNKNGTFTQLAGTTTVTETGFDLNNSSDSITGGTLNIGDGASVSDMSVSKGTIGANTVVNITENAALKVTGGDVSLGADTTYDGSIEMYSGTLKLESVTKSENAVYAQGGGTVTVNGKGFDLNNASDSVSGGTFNIGNGTTLTEAGVSKGAIKSQAVVNINTNAALNITGGSVNLDSSDTWDGTVNLETGTLNLNEAGKSSDAVFTQTGGTTTVSGTTFDLNNSSDTISGGNLNISDSSGLTVSKGTIESDAVTNISSGGTLNVTGGNVTLNDDDTWDGNVNVSGGNLNLDGITKNSSGVLTQTAGTTTVTNSGNTLNNENDTISGGKLIIGTSSAGGELDVNAGTIESDASVTINAKGTLNINGGTTALDGTNDTVKGAVNVTGGTLNLSDSFSHTTTTNGTFNQTGGTTNIDNSKLVLNTSDSKITGGTINLTSSGELEINNSSANQSEINSAGGVFTIRSGSTYTTTGGTIDQDTKLTIASGGTLELNSSEANVTIDGNNDSYAGHLLLTDGTLNLTDGVSKTTTTNGTFNQTGGTTNIDNSKLVLNTSDSKITGGEVNVTDSSELTVSNGEEHTSKLNVTGSNFGVKNGSTYTTTGGTIDSDSTVTIESGSKLTIDGDDAEVSLNGTNDTVDGSIELNSGNLYISDDLTKVTDADGNYIQTGGTLTMSSSKLILNDSESLISGGTVNLNNSTLTVTNAGADITGGNIVIDDTSVLNYLAEKGLTQAGGSSINIDTSGLINLVNNVKTDSVINNLTINNSTGDGQADFAIDIYARSNSDNSADTISANSIQVTSTGSDGTIHISDWNLTGDIYGYDAPIEKSIRLGKIFNSDDIGSEVQFTATDKEIFTPVGYYRLNASSANDGSYTFDLTRFNPQVFRGQVAAVSSYMNQLVVNDTLFNRANIRRYHSGYEEEFKNKTAVLDANASYERTLKDSSLWTEAFGNFETLKMTHGLDKVRNNSWGFIIGGDFGLKELRNGWKWMPTAYIAYNGGHQTFNKVSMYENGGQIGFMSSFAKENFINTSLVYGGLYGTTMDIGGTSEDTFNYFAGLANRASYDLHPFGPNFKIQPNLTLAYNLFGKQNWHADYGQMGMSSGFLNGFNIAPGVNFIWQKESWNMYATIAYTWNLFGGIDGQAGNVDLPSVRMKHGYLTWGLGMTKSFSDRWQMYAQATVRNIGRTGIICQGGFNYKL